MVRLLYHCPNSSSSGMPLLQSVQQLDSPDWDLAYQWIASDLASASMNATMFREKRLHHSLLQSCPGSIFVNKVGISQKTARRPPSSCWILKDFNVCKHPHPKGLSLRGTCTIKRSELNTLRLMNEPSHGSQAFFRRLMVERHLFIQQFSADKPRVMNGPSLKAYKALSMKGLLLRGTKHFQPKGLPHNMRLMSEPLLMVHKFLHLKGLSVRGFLPIDNSQQTN